jgi:hypothetical protein
VGGIRWHRTDRGTWVRVDSRTAGRIQAQSWIGAEAASVIPDVPKPGWLQSATWRDPAGETVWRAEEMQLVTEPAIVGTGAMLTTDPGLPDPWWTQLQAALAALARFTSFRVSGRQELITVASARSLVRRSAPSTPPSPNGPPHTVTCTGATSPAPIW